MSPCGLWTIKYGIYSKFHNTTWVMVTSHNTTQLRSTGHHNGLKTARWTEKELLGSHAVTTQCSSTIKREERRHFSILTPINSLKIPTEAISGQLVPEQPVHSEHEKSKNNNLGWWYEKLKYCHMRNTNLLVKMWLLMLNPPLHTCPFSKASN